MLDTGIAASALGQSALVAGVRVAQGAESLLSTLLYCAGRRARIAGATSVLAAVREAEAADSRCVTLQPVKGRSIAGLPLSAQRMDVFMHDAHASMLRASHRPSTQLFADEVAETIAQWIAGGRQWSFFAALRERRLAHPQYVNVLSNLYQFVRHTTRLIGRAIGHSVDPTLRRHWINHLNGEVNHELIIERDLAYMGEDVEFVKHHMPPSAPTHEFMAVQESAIGYYADPVLMMASPLAAEAVTAYLDQRFVDDLLACIRGWGFAEPRRAAQFLISHMNTDGGEDGHYRMSLDALPRLLPDEAKLALFLTTNASSRRAVGRIFCSCVDDTALWASA